MLFMCWPGALPGQYVMPYGPPYSYVPPVQRPLTPRERLALREQAIVYIGGPAARPFIEEMGEVGVAAVARCTQPVARQLAEFYAQGGLSKIHRSHEVILAIAAPDAGDDVAAVVLAHGSADLTDADKRDQFLTYPLEYSLGLRKFDNDGSKGKGSAAPSGFDWRAYRGIAGNVIVIVLLA